MRVRALSKRFGFGSRNLDIRFRLVDCILVEEVRPVALDDAHKVGLRTDEVCR